MPVKAAEERRWLTILFADLSGFTRLSSRLDPEDVREAVNICFEQLNQPIVDHAGTIHKYEGDLVMALFGYPEGHEDDPERAVKTSLAMMSLMPGINRRLKAELKIPGEVGLHIGVNSGLVVVGEIGSRAKRELTVMGDAVNLASRLNDAAENGEILVSETVYRQTGYLFDYEIRPAIAVKGKSEPVRIFQPRGLKTEPGSKRGIAGLSSPLVDREPESDALLKALKDPGDGRQRIVYLNGDAGLGKTRLLAEFKDRLRREKPGIRILEGACFSDTANVPYGPIRQILKQALGIKGGEDDRSLTAKIRSVSPEAGDDIVPYLNRLLAAGSEDREDVRIKYLEGRELQQQFRLSLKSFIGRLGSPLLMVVDDFHWIDPESLSFLDFLGTSRPAMPGLIVLISRSEANDRPGLTVRTWKDQPQVDLRVIDLSPLDDDHARELLNNLLITKGPDPGLKERFRARSNGNPLYLEEMIKVYLEAGGVAGAELPESLQALLTARLDRLDQGSRDLLLCASVIGRDFDLRILEAVAAGDEDTLSLNLARLETQGFLRRQSGAGIIAYSFTHPLLQEAAYLRLLKKQRRELHRRIAAAAEAIDPERLDEKADFLAYHYGFGDDDEKAIRWLRRAADRAMKDYANDEAIKYYSELVERIKSSGAGGLLEVYENLGELAMLKGDFPGALEHFQKMLEAGTEPVDRARSRRKAAKAWHQQGRFNEALQSLAEAERMLDDGGKPGEDERIEILVDRGWVNHLTGDNQQAVEFSRQALARIERLGSGNRKMEIMLVHSRALNNLGSIYGGRGEFVPAEASYQAGLEMSIKCDDQRGIAVAHSNLGIIATQQGKLKLAVEHYRQSIAIAERIGDRQSVSIARCNLGMVYLNEGNHGQALEEFQAYLLASEEFGDRRSQEIAHINLGTLRQRQDRFDEALDHLFRASVLGEQIGDKQNLDIAYLNIGTILRDRGEYEKGREYFERSRKLAEEIGDRIGVGMADGYLGEGLRRQKKYQAARELVERFRSVMEEIDYRSGLSIACYYLGLIEIDEGRESRAQELLFKAEKAAIEAGDTEFLATIRAALGKLRVKK